MRLTRRRPGWESVDQVQFRPTRLKRLSQSWFSRSGLSTVAPSLSSDLPTPRQPRGRDGAYTAATGARYTPPLASSAQTIRAILGDGNDSFHQFTYGREEGQLFQGRGPEIDRQWHRNPGKVEGVVTETVDVLGVVGTQPRQGAPSAAMPSVASWSKPRVMDTRVWKISRLAAR